MYLTKT